MITQSNNIDILEKAYKSSETVMKYSVGMNLTLAIILTILIIGIETRLSDLKVKLESQIVRTDKLYELLEKEGKK